MIAQIIIAILLVCSLSGCNKEYYAAINSQLELKLQEAELKLEAAQERAETPLFSHSYIDSDGNKHQIILNQGYGQGNTGRNSSIANVNIPSPAEIGFSYFDRTLSATERLLWLLKGGGGDRKSHNTSYVFGDDAYFQQSWGDGSPNGFQQEVTQPAPLEFEDN